ncbi:MAG: hypothetical protein V2I27_00750 [Erythrobacter sp.]|nr:hypothetical protein [Erythrobacter sp.]
MDEGAACLIGGGLFLFALASWLRLFLLDPGLRGRQKAVEGRFLIAVGSTSLALTWLAFTFLAVTLLSARPSAH